MKQYRLIDTEESIASFMVGFEKREMTYEEYNDWSAYLQEALTNDKYEASVYYGKEFLTELEHDDCGYLFNFGDKSINLAKGRTFDDLDSQVLAFLDADTLMAIVDAVDSYQKEDAGLSK